MFVARRGRSELTTAILSEGQVRELVEKMLKSTGRRVDLSTPSSLLAEEHVSPASTSARLVTPEMLLRTFRLPPRFSSCSARVGYQNCRPR